MAAIVLANHGFEVTLVDRIRDPGSLSEQQTYMMAVNLRALKALRQAGITLPADVALPLEGSAFHFGGKTVYNGFKPEEEENVSAGRNELARFLITAAERHASGRIRVLQGWTLYALEDEGDVARFRRTRQGEGAGKVAGDFVSEEMRNEEGEDRMDMLNYDLLLGADGVNSLVRSELVRFDKERKLPKKERCGRQLVAIRETIPGGRGDVTFVHAMLFNRAVCELHDRRLAHLVHMLSSLRFVSVGWSQIWHNPEQIIEQFCTFT